MNDDYTSVCNVTRYECFVIKNTNAKCKNVKRTNLDLTMIECNIKNK